MAKFSKLLATGSLTAATSLLWTAPIALANPLQARILQKEANLADISEFMTNYAPTECTIQFGYVETENLPQRLAANFTQTMDSVMVNQPVSDCEAVTGTDDGETRNFNFIRAQQGVYKVITESAATYDEEDFVYRVKVLGVRFIPINQEGALDPDQARTFLSIGAGNCEIDKTEDPYDVFCEFATMDSNPAELAVGQLSYFH